MRIYGSVYAENSIMNIYAVCRSLRLAFVSVCLIGLAENSLDVGLGAEPPPPGKSADAAIRATEKAFVEAFNRGDVKAVAELWTPNGSLTDDRGRVFKGRKAIEEEYARFFATHRGANIEVAIESIEQPTADVAIEVGVARALSKGVAAPSASRYMAVHVRVDGQWQMANVSESSIEMPSGYGRLRDFDWLVGQWESKNGEATVLTTIRWIANQSYLQREYTVRKAGVTESSGLQIIGWDPQTGRIRSWSFDSTGGNGSGLWNPVGNGWRIESRGVLADGTPTSSQDHLIRVPGEDNVLGWRSTDRKIGGRPLPDLREVVLERLPEKTK
jgi:uncharacterized protein (TIGR02246 family)